jgi:multiple sugar transport system substrate-binding protein
MWSITALLLSVAINPAWAQKTTLKMWTFLATQGTDPRSAALRSIVEKFNSSQDKYEVKVESINFARIDNQVIQATAAGQGPDILNVYSDQLSMHVAAKTIRPLDDFVSKMPATERDDFISNLKFFKFKDKIMALPWETRVWLLWYRQDILDKAGVKVPQTLDELGQVAGKISTEQAMGFGIGASTAGLGAGAMEAFVPIFWGAGGQLFDDKGNATVNSEAGVKTLSFFRNLVVKDKGMRPTVVSMSVDDAMSAIRAGTIYMTVMGSFRVGAARGAPATGDNLQTAPVPGWSANKPSPARLAGQTLAIGANTKNAAGAWAFIQHYLSTASQLEFARAGVMPSRRSTYQDAFFKEGKDAAEIQKWIAYANANGRMESTPPDFSKLSEEVAKAMQRVIIQGDDPKKALDDAAAAYNAQRKS